MNANITLKLFPLVLSAASAIAVATPSQAASFSPLQSISPLQSTGLDCTSSVVTAGGNSFTACQGAFQGNDTGSTNPLLTALNGGLFQEYVNGGTWSLLGKSDENQFLADQNQTAGSWSLLADSSLKGPFVLSLKANNAFSAFLFTDVSEVSSGTFTTAGVSTNGKGIAQALSHASIFVLETSAEDEIVELNEPSFSIGGIFAVLVSAPLLLMKTKTNQA